MSGSGCSWGAGGSTKIFIVHYEESNQNTNLPALINRKSKFLHTSSIRPKIKFNDKVRAGSMRHYKITTWLTSHANQVNMLRRHSRRKRVRLEKCTKHTFGTKL